MPPKRLFALSRTVVVAPHPPHEFTTYAAQVGCRKAAVCLAEACQKAAFFFVSFSPAL